MSFVVDLSYGWPVCTGEALKRIGATGVIGYTGCDDIAKNVGRDIFQSWLDAGLQVALVIENGPQDMLGGSKAGAYLGQNWLRGAEALGYDIEHCIGYTAADWHVQANQLQTLSDAYFAFAGEVPVAGLYGPGPALNYVSTYPGQITPSGLWNSNSTSFGPISVHANLIQRYDDPRAQGMPVDINDIGITPLYFMNTNTPREERDMSEVAGLISVNTDGTWLIDPLFQFKNHILTVPDVEALQAVKTPAGWNPYQSVILSDAMVNAIPLDTQGSAGSLEGNYTSTGTITVTKES